VTVALLLTWAHGQEAPPADPPAAPLAEAEPPELTAEEFLRHAQRPLLQDAWARFTGTIQHQRSDQKRRKVLIRLAARFAPDSLRADVVLDGKDVYRISQQYTEGKLPEVRLDLPPVEGEIGLRDLGIEAEDITFSFLHWDLVRELEPDSIRGQPCRVLDLTHPRKGETVRVHISRDYGFPLKAAWYHPNLDTPWRRLEFKDFKRTGEIWFVQEILLQGDDWKTRVTFDQVEGAPVSTTPPPAELFGQQPGP
jgi:hypothetical protein